MSTAEQPYLSPAEYLEAERAALDAKHEYHAGDMFLMAGASREHNQLTFNLTVMLGNHLKDRDCDAFASSMRVKVDLTGLYTYPDLVVTCEEPEFEDEHVDTLLNPQVIIKVLSESTETYDRGKKFEPYRQVPSLREYLLVAQDRPHIERFVREENGDWRLTEATGADASITIALLDLPLSFGDVYSKVAFKTEKGEANDPPAV